ncbi:MAG: hypothetical protein ACKPKO_21880 [Candidatus Fonsibacter sp.]
MDAIRLRQIDEALGYDKHTNAMVFDMETKRVAQNIREMPKDSYAMIDAQKIMEATDAANSMRLMLDGKSGGLSVIAHPGADVDSEQFARAAQDVWQVEAVVSKVQRDIRSVYVGKRLNRAATKHIKACFRADAVNRRH